MVNESAQHFLPALAGHFLLHPGTDDHKYTRGVLACRTGSSAYPGAAVLSCRAALHTGLGMLRYVPEMQDAGAALPGTATVSPALPAPEAAVLTACPEAVFGLGGRAPNAYLVGSGTDPAKRSQAETAWLRELVEQDVPLVADAGALDVVAQALHTKQAASARPVLLTPHRGEFAGVLRSLALPETTSVRELAVLLRATILLKGSTTQIASPIGQLLLAGPATPWLATAGTGDVLAGIAGALVAAHAARLSAEELALRLPEIAATAAVLHDYAGRAASSDTAACGEGHPLTAVQLADSIPSAFLQLRNF